MRVQSRHARVVLDGEGGEIRCSLRKTLFSDHSEFTRPVAVGDRVRVTVFGPRDAVVEEVLPRRCYLSRLQPETGREQIMVANAHQVVITVSVEAPAFRPRVVDRILVSAERGGLEAVIVMSKSDLVDDRTPYEDVAGVWRSLGYVVVFTSTETGEGVDEVRSLMADRMSVLAGQSGVGKSSLLNAIEPGLGLRARTISQKWGKGRHTTSAACLLPLASGGFVVDTPGIRSWGIVGLETADIALFFPDLSPYIETCRYNECTHDHEPDCAVKAAVDQGRVDQRRYESYLRIIAGMEED